MGCLDGGWLLSQINGCSFISLMEFWDQLEIHLVRLRYYHPCKIWVGSFVRTGPGCARLLSSHLYRVFYIWICLRTVSHQVVIPYYLGAFCRAVLLSQVKSIYGLSSLLRLGFVYWADCWTFKRRGCHPFASGVFLLVLSPCVRLGSCHLMWTWVMHSFVIYFHDESIEFSSLHD